MKFSVVTGASFVSSRQVNVPMLVSNTAFAGLGSGFFSVSFPQALKEKQTTRHRHKSKILRKANPPYFQQLADFFRNHHVIGNFHILRRPEDDAFLPYEGHILHSFLFGPGLVIDGKLMTDDEDTFVRNIYGSGAGMGLGNKTQRQAICQMGKLSYLILTTEGPNSKQDKDHGFTAAELAQVAYDVGAVNAYNMDGGNSACLVLNGIKLNRFGKGGIREITDMLYFITAEAPAAATEAPAEAPTETEGSTAP